MDNVAAAEVRLAITANEPGLSGALPGAELAGESAHRVSTWAIAAGAEPSQEPEVAKSVGPFGCPKLESFEVFSVAQSNIVHSRHSPASLYSSSIRRDLDALKWLEGPSRLGLDSVLMA
jgi:hypothetical protein